MIDDRIDRLDAERRDEPFAAELPDGSVLRTRHPRDLGWRWLCEPDYLLLPHLIDPRDAMLLAALLVEDVDDLVAAYRDHYGIGSAAEAAELVWLLQRCVDDATYDLATHGIDLGELWRERRWRFLWTLVMHLPRHSQTKERLACNEEFVERVLAGTDDKDEGKQAIRMAEFSPEVEALYMVIDRLGDVVSGLVGLGGRKPKRISPMTRPSTAFDRVRHRRRLTEHKSLAARVLTPADLSTPGFPST